MFLNLLFSGSLSSSLGLGSFTSFGGISFLISVLIAYISLSRILLLVMGFEKLGKDIFDINFNNQNSQ